MTRVRKRPGVLRVTLRSKMSATLEGRPMSRFSRITLDRAANDLGGSRLVLSVVADQSQEHLVRVAGLESPEKRSHVVARARIEHVAEQVREQRAAGFTQCPWGAQELRDVLQEVVRGLVPQLLESLLSHVVGVDVLGQPQEVPDRQNTHQEFGRAGLHDLEGNGAGALRKIYDPHGKHLTQLSVPNL